MTGIASKKENFAASSLDKPRKSPAVIVIPDLDVPGLVQIPEISLLKTLFLNHCNAFTLMFIPIIG
jgi:hypothetical protein